MLSKSEKTEMKKVITLSSSDLMTKLYNNSTVVYNKILNHDSNNNGYEFSNDKLTEIFKSSSDNFFMKKSIDESSIITGSDTLKSWILGKEKQNKPVEDQITKSSNSIVDLQNAKTLDQNLLDNIKTTLSELLSNDLFRVGYDSSTSIYFRNLLTSNPDYAMKGMLEVFYDNYHNHKIVEGILNVLSILEYDKVVPEGPIMALTLTSYDNDTIKEALIRVFENWCNKDSIRLLETIKFDDEWLDNYRLEVIEDIKEYY